MKKSGSLLNQLTDIDMNNKYLVSLDIKSLYTPYILNIPVDKCIERLHNHIRKSNSTFPQPIPKLIKICTLCTLLLPIIIMSCRQHGYPWPSLVTSPYHSSPLAGLQGYILCPHIAAVCKFKLVVLLLLGHMWGSIQYNNIFYKQKFGLPMGSPLCRVLTCIYLEFLESGPFKYIIPNSAHYFRYIDDILLIYPQDLDLHSIIDRLNNVEPSIKVHLWIWIHQHPTLSGHFTY